MGYLLLRVIMTHSQINMTLIPVMIGTSSTFKWKPRFVTNIEGIKMKSTP